MEKDDIYDTASKTVGLIDKEPTKDNQIVVSVTGGKRLFALGVLYGCYARADRVARIVTNTASGDELSELPKLNYNLRTGKREILQRIVKRNGKTVMEIAKELGRTKGAVYQHLRELKEAGYVDEDFNITDAGRLALL